MRSRAPSSAETFNSQPSANLTSKTSSAWSTQARLTAAPPTKTHSLPAATPAGSADSEELEVAAPFLLASGYLDNVRVLKAYVTRIVKPGAHYMQEKLLNPGRGDGQIIRMRIARILNPLHAQKHPPTVQEIDVMVGAFGFSSARNSEKPRSELQRSPPDAPTAMR